MRRSSASWVLAACLLAAATGLVPATRASGQDDCGTGADAPSDGAPGTPTLPATFSCEGALPTGDGQDAYYVQAWRGETLSLHLASLGAPTKACIFDGVDNLDPLACASAAAGGSADVSYVVDWTGPWLIELSHNDALNGTYAIRGGVGAGAPDDCRTQRDAPDAAVAAQRLDLPVSGCEAQVDAVGDVDQYAFSTGAADDLRFDLGVPEAGVAVTACLYQDGSATPAACLSSGSAPVEARLNRTLPASWRLAVVSTGGRGHYGFSLVALHAHGSMDGAPVVRYFACDPGSLAAGATVTCYVLADDDSPAITVEVDWGDGTQGQAFSPGLFGFGPHAPGLPLKATHIYASAGVRNASAFAVDSNDFGETHASRDARAQVRVGAPLDHHQLAWGVLSAPAGRTPASPEKIRDVWDTVGDTQAETVSLRSPSALGDVVTLSWTSPAVATLRLDAFAATGAPLAASCTAVPLGATSQSCALPAGAAYAQVRLEVGAGAAFTLNDATSTVGFVVG